MNFQMKDRVISFGLMHNRLHRLNPKNNNAHAPEQLKDGFNKKDEEYDKMKV